MGVAIADRAIGHRLGVAENRARQGGERGIDGVASHPAGEPAQVLCDYARQHDCDLIVIGHRHLSRMERLFERSVGQWTIDHAPCPVLVEVRDAGP